jgi:NADPH-dependent 2,4-dienoyl-CoA reductase/sulfur reductase-like enzyme/rhodanese-related sulfurtransferase
MAPKRVLIVGGVAGGAACAARLRRLDEQAQIFLFERGPSISFANCGLPYYLGGVIEDRQRLLVASPERFRDWFQVEVRARTEVTAIHRLERTAVVRNVAGGTQTTEPYDALVLAPGAVAVRPPVAGIDLPGVFTLRNLEDTDRIYDWLSRRKPRRAVVVGGGYIGLEMVENLHRRGIEVAVLERLDQVMPPMDREMVVPAHEELRRHGVDLRLGTPLAAIEPAGKDSLPSELAVVAEGGERFTAGVVIVAVGVKPDAELARRAGLDIGALGGIVVDQSMRTSDAAIWAVGDAVEVPDFVTGHYALAPLAGPAARQGRIAADSICGRPARYRGSQGTAVVGVFGLTLAMTGGSEKSLRRAGMLFEKLYLHAAQHAAYYPGAEPMALKILFSPQDGRLLGAQAAGRSGVDKRIDVLAMAIQKGATVYDLEEAELCYAPQYGSAKDPVNMAGFAAANILRGDVAVAHWSQWRALQAAGTLPVVLDVRSPDEVAASQVPGSVHIPLGELRRRLDELPRDREIWVHCGAGQRSYYACRILAQRGFRVRNLSGGMQTYQMLHGK